MSKHNNPPFPVESSQSTENNQVYPGILLIDLEGTPGYAGINPSADDLLRAYLYLDKQDDEVDEIDDPNQQSVEEAFLEPVPWRVI